MVYLPVKFRRNMFISHGDIPPAIQTPASSVTMESCQVRVYSGRGSGQVRMEMDEGQGQGAGQGVSPAGVGDRLDSTTKDNER